jgi:3-oxoadipate enol-lactonase
MTTTQIIDRMAVETEGEGDPVLMIHGLGGTSNTWCPVLPVFQRNRTIRPDLPGSGRSGRVEGALSIDRYVQAMQRICGAMNAARVHVVAHSMGTIVAMHLAARMPALVRSLALFGPLLCPPDTARGPLKARGQKARGGEGAMQEIADAIVQAATSSETKAQRPVTVALVRESLMRQPPEGYARSCDALSEAQAVDVHDLKCPTLLVTGDEDQVAPTQSVRLLGERISGARVEVLTRCGHWPTYEKPEACVDSLRRFYAQRI